MLRDGFLGGAMLFASAFYLLCSLTTNSIPANWPIGPIPREQRPELFRLLIMVWTAIGLTGAVILMLDLLGW